MSICVPNISTCTVHTYSYIRDMLIVFNIQYSYSLEACGTLNAKCAPRTGRGAAAAASSAAHGTAQEATVAARVVDGARLPTQDLALLSLAARVPVGHSEAHESRADQRRTNARRNYLHRKHYTTCAPLQNVSGSSQRKYFSLNIYFTVRCLVLRYL